MTKDQYRALIEAAEECGLEPRDYSGRGMYGKRCLGFETDNPVAAAVDLCTSIVANADSDSDSLELLEELQRPQQDSMGMSSILYFEGVKWIDPDTLDESEDDSEDCNCPPGKCGPTGA